MHGRAAEGFSVSARRAVARIHTYSHRAGTLLHRGVLEPENCDGAQSSYSSEPIDVRIVASGKPMAQWVRHMDVGMVARGPDRGPK
jgi:hypothetical protein